MERTSRGWYLWPLLCALRSEALHGRGVSEAAVTTATRAVLRRFGEHSDELLDPESQRRVTAYFWGVLRRQAVRVDPGYARRVVRATVAADLRDAGWDPGSIRAELERAGLSA